MDAPVFRAGGVDTAPPRCRGMACAVWAQCRAERLALLPLAVVLLLLLRVSHRLWLHPLRHVPGPRLAGATRLWRARRYARGTWHADVVRLHEQYGPVVRIAPNEVSFVDKDALVTVYGHASGSRKTSWYDVWGQPGASTGFFAATDPHEHAFLRRRVATAYTMSTFLSLEPQIDNVGELAWMRLDRMAADGTVVDIQQWASFFAFDVVGSLGVGGPLGFLKHGADVKGIMASIHGMFYISAILGDLPGQLMWIRNPVFQALARLFTSSLTAGASFQQWLMSQVQERLNERPGEKERQRDMLDHFIAMKERDGSPVTLPGVLIEAGNLIGAGADTTSSGISSCIGELVLHPEDYRAVQREVDHLCSSGSLEPGRSIDFKSAEKLPWLTACVKEALRLNPSIVWQLPRHAPTQGITIAGCRIPGTAVVGMSPYAMNRDLSIFGNDAMEWNPSRYIAGSSSGTTEEYIRSIEKFTTTFGYGSRTCVGRNLALIEIYRFVAEFARRYDIEPVAPAQPYRQFSQWFMLNKDFNVRLHPRDETCRSTVTI